MKKNIAIIGAGLGGLAASIRLAKAGFCVDVYEQNELSGGKAGIINESGFRFDTGPSLLTMPFIIDELFEFAEENVEDYLQIKKLEILCKYFFYDGTIINAYSNKKTFADEIEAKTGDSSLSVLNYLDYCKNIYDLTSNIFLFNNPKKFSNYLNLNAFRTLLKIREIDSFRTMHSANSSFFKDKKTIQLFDRFATYNGSNPYKAPATFNLIQHVEYSLGGYIAEGGMYSVTEAIFNLAKKSGVNFYFNSKVNGIVYNNTVSGININGRKSNYNILISNVDVNTTNKVFLKSEYSPAPKDLSSSALVFYWGINGIHNEFTIHNILFSLDYKNEFDDIFIKETIPDDPTIYIYISSKFNSDDASEGCENWFVMINTPSIGDQNWEEEIAKSRKNILAKIKSISGINLSNKILFEKILSPKILETRTGSFKGSIYGHSSNTKFSAFLRQPNKSKKIKGLYFCGGSVHPGGGLPLVLLSGKNAAEAIIKDYD